MPGLACCTLPLPLPLPFVKRGLSGPGLSPVVPSAPRHLGLSIEKIIKPKEEEEEQEEELSGYSAHMRISHIATLSGAETLCSAVPCRY